jgi:hypothetical protein
MVVLRSLLKDHAMSRTTLLRTLAGRFHRLGLMATNCWMRLQRGLTEMLHFEKVP